MSSVFLDTSYVVALEVKNDQHHAAAVSHWNSAAHAGNVRFVTTTFVFGEIVTFLNRRGRHDVAVHVGNRLLGSEFVQLVDVDRAQLEEAWRFFQQHRDKSFSLTDCISFLVMKQLGITTAYSFDHHFRQAGLAIEP